MTRDIRTSVLLIFNLIYCLNLISPASALSSSNPSPNRTTTAAVVWKIDELWDGDRQASLGSPNAQDVDVGPGKAGSGVDVLVTDQGVFEAKPGIGGRAANQTGGNVTDDLDEEYNKYLICNLVMDIGQPCLESSAAVLSYYYSPTAGNCRDFMFAGCQGNANNFKTMGECAAYCDGVLSTPIGSDFDYNEYYEENNSYYNEEVEFGNSTEAVSSMEYDFNDDEDDIDAAEDVNGIDGSSQNDVTATDSDMDSHHQNPNYQEQIHPINSNSMRSFDQSEAAKQLATSSNGGESQSVLNNGGSGRRGAGAGTPMFGSLGGSMIVSFVGLCLLNALMHPCNVNFGRYVT